MQTKDFFDVNDELLNLAWSCNPIIGGEGVETGVSEYSALSFPVYLKV